MNTERPTTIAEQKKQTIVNTPVEKPQLKANVVKKEEVKDIVKKQETKPEPKKTTKPKIKKTQAVVRGVGLPISTKYSVAICKFIKNKKIEKAIEGLEQAALKKKAIPMKGEIAHKKGKRMSSGKFPKKASEHFITLLKSLQSNANELDNPIIGEAMANLASRPFGRFGRIKRKRTHVKIIAMEKNKLKKKIKQQSKEAKK